MSHRALGHAWDSVGQSLKGKGGAGEAACILDVVFS